MSKLLNCQKETLKQLQEIEIINDITDILYLVSKHSGFVLNHIKTATYNKEFNNLKESIKYEINLAQRLNLNQKLYIDEIKTQKTCMVFTESPLLTDPTNVHYYEFKKNQVITGFDFGDVKFSIKYFIKSRWQEYQLIYNENKIKTVDDVTKFNKWWDDYLKLYCSIDFSCFYGLSKSEVYNIFLEYTKTMDNSKSIIKNTDARNIVNKLKITQNLEHIIESLQKHINTETCVNTFKIKNPNNKDYEFPCIYVDRMLITPIFRSLNDFNNNYEEFDNYNILLNNMEFKIFQDLKPTIILEILKKYIDKK